MGYLKYLRESPPYVKDVSPVNTIESEYADGNLFLYSSDKTRTIVFATKHLTKPISPSVAILQEYELFRTKARIK